MLRYIFCILFVSAVVVPIFYPLATIDFRLSPVEREQSQPLRKGRAIDQSVVVDPVLIRHASSFCVAPRFAVPKNVAAGTVYLQLVGGGKVIAEKATSVSGIRNGSYLEICTSEKDLPDLRVLISGDFEDKSASPSVWLMNETSLGRLARSPEKSVQISVRYETLPFHAWPSIPKGLLLVLLVALPGWLLVRFGFFAEGRA